MPWPEQNIPHIFLLVEQHRSFSAFVINAVTIAKIRLDLRQRHELAAKLETARQTLRAAAKILPTCPLCGKAHPQPGRNGQAELRDLARDNADLSGALCAECAQPVRRS